MLINSLFYQKGHCHLTKPRSFVVSIKNIKNWQEQILIWWDMISILFPFRGLEKVRVHSRGRLILIFLLSRRLHCDQICHILLPDSSDALRQPLLYIIVTFRTGGGSPTTFRQLS